VRWTADSAWVVGGCLAAELLAIAWARWGWARAVARWQALPKGVQEPISVVVCLRNEEKNVEGIVKTLLALTFVAPYDLVLVDDRSTDGTASLLAEAAAADARIHIVTINQTPPGWAPKKYALTKGISAAAYDLLALTDADCRPGPGWLAEIARGFTAGADVIIGLSPPAAGGGWLAGPLARHEAAWAAGHYVAAAVADKPYMAVGRNIAYRKSWFEAQGGLSSHQAVLSGDDDLLIARASRSKVMVCPEAAGIVPTAPPASLGIRARQRARHIGAAWHYPGWALVLLGLVQLAVVLGSIGRVWGLLSMDIPILILLAGACFLRLSLSFASYLRMNAVLELFFFPVIDFLLIAEWAVAAVRSLWPVRWR
jgi:hypothetical protein